MAIFSAANISVAIINITDDTLVVGLITENDDRAYLEEVKNLEEVVPEK